MTAATFTREHPFHVNGMSYYRHDAMVMVANPHGNDFVALDASSVHAFVEAERNRGWRPDGDGYRLGPWYIEKPTVDVIATIPASTRWALTHDDFPDTTWWEDDDVNLDIKDVFEGFTCWQAHHLAEPTGLGAVIKVTVNGRASYWVRQPDSRWKSITGATATWALLTEFDGRIQVKAPGVQL